MTKRLNISPEVFHTEGARWISREGNLRKIITATLLVKQILCPEVQYRSMLGLI